MRQNDKGNQNELDSNSGQREPEEHVFQVGVGMMLLATPIAFWLGLPVLTTSIFVGCSVMTLMSIHIRREQSPKWPFTESVKPTGTVP